MLVMNRIELAIAKVTEFLRDMDENSTQLVKSVLETVKVANEDNIMAQIQVGHIDTITVDISKYQYGEDYVVLTGRRYRDVDGNEFKSIDEAREFYFYKVSNQWQIRKNYLVSSADDSTFYDNFDSFKDAVDYIYRKDERTFSDDGVSIKPYYFIYDENDCVVGGGRGYHSEEEAEEQFEIAVEEKAEELVDSLEIETDKIMWDTVWNFNYFDIDIDLAKKCNLAVVEFRSGQFEDVTCLGFTDYYVDVFEQLTAYKALRFGCITERDAQTHFSTKEKRDRFKHVVGLDLAREVYRKLGIEKFFDESGE